MSQHTPEPMDLWKQICSKMASTSPAEAGRFQKLILDWRDAERADLLSACEACRDYFDKIDEMQPDKNHGMFGTLVRNQVAAAIAKDREVTT